MIRGWPGSGDIVSDFYTIWSSEIRYIGVGAMIVGGVYTLWSMKDTIKDGLVKALKAANSEDDTNILRTEKDIPLDKVILACGVLVLLTFFFYWYATGSVVLALAVHYFWLLSLSFSLQLLDILLE